MAFTGLNANSAKHLQLDAGAFVKNYDVTSDTWATAQAKVIGATAGGGSFAAIPTVRRIEIDGAKSAVKGFEAVDEWQVTLTANVKEITVDTLKLALATGASKAATAPAGYTEITAHAEISDDDYIDNITWIGRISGSDKPVIIVVNNALCTNGLTLTTADKSEGVIALTITGHSDPTDIDKPPFAIYYPDIA